jgi:type ISP restriction-modification system protein
VLAEAYEKTINAEDVAAYLYGVLAHSGYTDRFQTELANRQVRVPVTLERKLFEEACTIGKRLVYLHTYGERFSDGETWSQGRARCNKAVSTDNIGLPEKFRYDPSKEALYVGDGMFTPIDIAVWEFEVSGLKVVQSWLGYRLKTRRGRRSSPLDGIAPTAWPAEFTSELLRLLHLLEETLETYSRQHALLARIVQGPLLLTDNLGPVPEEYRLPQHASALQHQLGI